MTESSDPTRAGQDDAGEPRVPPMLAEELLEAFGPDSSAPMPPSIDRKIRHAAASHFEVGSRRHAWQWGGLAAAASVVLISGVVFWSQTPHGSGPPMRGRVADESGAATSSVQHAAADLNADGNVDVLDALILAKAVDAGESPLDLTGDGAASKADVDALAARIVTLRSRG